MRGAEDLQRNQIRICLFTASLIGGGGRRVLINLATEFLRQGYTVDFVVGRKEGSFIAEVPAAACIHYLHVPQTIRALPGLTHYLRAARPTALLADDTGTSLVALWARALSRVRTRVIGVVSIIHSWEYTQYPTWKNRLAPCLFRIFIPWADGIIAMSHEAARDFAAMTGLPVHSMRVVYNPILISELMRKAQEPLDHPWFAPGSPPIILGVGRLVEVKDFATLIRAFALVRQQRRAHLMILGEGAERSALEELIRELNLQDDVVLPGFVQNPYAYMRRSAVFVLSSLAESFGNVLIEAMATGTSIVCTDCPGGIREVLEDGRYSALVPVGDAPAMAAAICAALDAPPDVAALQRRAHDFSLDKSFAQYAEVLLGGEWDQPGAHPE